MLKITVPAAEFWDEIHEEFVYKKEQTLQLEHSLVSLSKWESKWNKAFLGKQEKTDEEILDYVRCMTLTQNVDPEVYTRLSAENYAAINAYIEAPIVTTAFEGEVEVTRLFKYGEDFFIGDIVQIANEYGNEGSAYISELVISNSEEGLSIYPTFKTISK